MDGGQEFWPGQLPLGWVAYPSQNDASFGGSVQSCLWWTRKRRSVSSTDSETLDFSPIFQSFRALWPWGDLSVLQFPHLWNGPSDFASRRAWSWLRRFVLSTQHHAQHNMLPANISEVSQQVDDLFSDTPLVADGAGAQTPPARAVFTAGPPSYNLCHGKQCKGVRSHI